MSDSLGADKDKKELPGVLAILSLSVHERETLIDYFQASRPQAYMDYIFALMGDKEFLKFYDAMAGRNVKVPSRETMVKVINYVKIYCYCKSRGFTPESYDKAAKIFSKRSSAVKKIIDKVDKLLKKAEQEEESNV